MQWFFSKFLPLQSPKTEKKYVDDKEEPIYLYDIVYEAVNHEALHDSILNMTH